MVEINHYRGGDMGYTVRAGCEHLSLLLVYLFGVFFSNYLWVSLLFSVFVLIGLYSLLTENWKAIETWIFLSIPILFIPYMSQQRVMMVRNDLLLFPFLAILCAGGMLTIWNSTFFRSSRIARTAVVVGLTGALLINYNWLYLAARSIPASATTDRPRELQKYLLENSETTFYLSPEARQGNLNVIIRVTEADGLHVYQIKGNVMFSLAVQVGPGTATFTGKASIIDITDASSPVSVDGNATFKVTVDDNGESGSSDTIGITLWNKNGGLWFSSRWNGTNTVEQLLAGGNLVVR